MTTVETIQPKIPDKLKAEAKGNSLDKILDILKNALQYTRNFRFGMLYGWTFPHSIKAGIHVSRSGV